MATNLDVICQYLGQGGYRYVRDEQHELVTIPFDHERVGKLVAMVTLEEDGAFLKIFSPKLFTYLDGPHKLPLMQTLLLISWETKMLQWEYDPSDGEIRATIEFPLEDAVLTRRQFDRAFGSLLQMIELFHPRLKAVIETGSDPGRAGGHTPSDDMMRAFQEFLNGREGGGDGGAAPVGSGGGGSVPDAL